MTGARSHILSESQALTLEPILCLFFQPSPFTERKCFPKESKAEKESPPQVSELRSTSVWHGLVWGVIEHFQSWTGVGQ